MTINTGCEVGMTALGGLAIIGRPWAAAYYAQLPGAAVPSVTCEPSHLVAGCGVDYGDVTVAIVLDRDAKWVPSGRVKDLMFRDLSQTWDTSKKYTTEPRPEDCFSRIALRMLTDCLPSALVSLGPPIVSRGVPCHRTHRRFQS